MGVHAEVAAPEGAAADIVQTGFPGLVDKAVEFICVLLMLAALTIAAGFAREPDADLHRQPFVAAGRRPDDCQDLVPELDAARAERDQPVGR
jgi:hypothetical protein